MLIIMERPHIITLSGKPGSGKSSTSDKVAELLNYTRYSSGDIVRKIIKKEGLTLAEFNKQAEEYHKIDHLIDDELRKLRNEQDIVIDSRLGFYWIPESFKVYLNLDIDVAIARIYKDMAENKARGVESGNSMTEVMHNVKSRLKSEEERFTRLYGVNPYRLENFDLVVDTSRHSPQTVALAIFDNYQKWLKTEVWDPVVEQVPMGYSFKNQY
jgi:CMP/dCMP kinase